MTDTDRSPPPSTVDRDAPTEPELPVPRPRPKLELPPIPDPTVPHDVTTVDVLTAFHSHKTWFAAALEATFDQLVDVVREEVGSVKANTDARAGDLVDAVNRLVSSRQEHVGIMTELGRCLRDAGNSVLASVEPRVANGHGPDAE